ncbi:alpha-mannosidase [Cohnella herbarum]|uniref:Alpha-mannosidase n=1 Tax=Cohnella herbarum TaxID=2728023 RepID=A0A7Z2ZME5_9BACL|nr:alpha-mannosidase [Cohnella herbarum]QJD84889.1 alpha-mannosidase [Cohnella herbarum]
MSRYESILAEMHALQPKHYWSERILGQLGYAVKLSKLNNGEFDGLLAEVVTDLSLQVEKSGVISKELAMETEGKLSALSVEAKRYRMICAGHAHIDMNWMWGWDETVSVTLDTFRTVLDLMRQYPDFRFSQSQAAIYKIVEDHAPEMLDEIKRRIKEGRWEVTASHWVEADKNMPNGESLSRHLLYTKRYLSRLLDLGSDSFDLDFEPDTFGHSENVPEILADGGVKYYYHCRGDEGHQIYRWIAPSGRSVTAYREPIWYNGEITAEMAWYVPEFCGRHGLNTMLKVYGVGDHGGGPTRRDIERIKDMAAWPIYPSVSFGTFRDFFRLTDAIVERLPEVRGERNFVFTGCYTSQSRIKMANRYGEAALKEAETFGTFAALAAGFSYRNEVLSDAWKNVLFNQFHDILPGSGVVATREHAMGLFQNTMASANSVRKLAMQRIADSIDTSEFGSAEEGNKRTTSEGSGAGFLADRYRISHVERGAGKTRIFHLFNSASFEREEACEITIWDWNGDIAAIQAAEDQGMSIRHQVVDHGFNPYWGHHYLTLLIFARVPAFGYATFVLTEGERTIPTPPYPDPRKEQPVSAIVLENGNLIASFDRENASLVSLIDKKSGREMIGNTDVRVANSAVFRFIVEDTDTEMTAWYVGRYKSSASLHKEARIRDVNVGKGRLRQSFAYEIPFANSLLKVTVSLDEDSDCLAFEAECDWQEKGGRDSGIPQLGFHVPLAYGCESYKYDVPYGVIKREALEMDVPATSWALGESKEPASASLMLVTDSKYGYRGCGQALNVSLIRSSYDPDPYPELGIHRFRIGLIVIAETGNRELSDRGDRFNHPLNMVSGTFHSGNLPSNDSFLQLEEGSIAISAVKMAEDGGDGVIIRYYETDGNGGQAVLRLSRPIKKVERIDVHEQGITGEGWVRFSGRQAILSVKPYELAAVRIELE